MFRMDADHQALLCTLDELTHLCVLMRPTLDALWQLSMILSGQSCFIRLNRAHEQLFMSLSASVSGSLIQQEARTVVHVR
jgi:hypothetical protein